MGTTDANGIYMYDDTDGAPTPPVLNVGQQSVSDALSNLGSYHVVANVSERSAYLVDNPATATTPRLFYRIDAGAGLNWEWTANGTTFQPLVSRAVGHLERGTTAFSVPNVLETVLTGWDSADLQGGMTLNNTTGALTVPHNGLYRVSFTFDWVSNSTGGRAVNIMRNLSFSVLADFQSAQVGRITSTRGSRVIRMNAGDNFRLRGVQSSGATLSASYTNQPITLSVEYVGP